MKFIASLRFDRGFGVSSTANFALHRGGNRRMRAAGADCIRALLDGRATSELFTRGTTNEGRLPTEGLSRVAPPQSPAPSRPTAPPTTTMSSALMKFINSPTGPKTTHFWGPVANWGFVLAGLEQTTKPEAMISGPMTGALTVYSGLFMRFAWRVQPRNYILFACHTANGSVQVRVEPSDPRDASPASTLPPAAKSAFSPDPLPRLVSSPRSATRRRRDTTSRAGFSGVARKRGSRRRRRAPPSERRGRGLAPRGSPRRWARRKF